MKTLKAVMPRSEELKKLLKAQYDIEYADYLQMLEIERQRQAELLEEQRKLKLQQEGKGVSDNHIHPSSIETIVEFRGDSGLR